MNEVESYKGNFSAALSVILENVNAVFIVALQLAFRSQFKGILLKTLYYSYISFEVVLNELVVQPRSSKRTLIKRTKSCFYGSFAILSGFSN